MGALAYIPPPTAAPTNRMRDQHRGLSVRSAATLLVAGETPLCAPAPPVDRSRRGAFPPAMPGDRRAYHTQPRGARPGATTHPPCARQRSRRKNVCARRVAGQDIRSVGAPARRPQPCRRTDPPKDRKTARSLAGRVSSVICAFFLPIVLASGARPMVLARLRPLLAYDTLPLTCYTHAGWT